MAITNARRRESVLREEALRLPSRADKGCATRKETVMPRSPIALLLLVLATAVSGCVAPILAGGTAAIVADQVAEDERGGDGLF